MTAISRERGRNQYIAWVAASLGVEKANCFLGLLAAFSSGNFLLFMVPQELQCHCRKHGAICASIDSPNSLQQIKRESDTLAAELLAADI